MRADTFHPAGGGGGRRGDDSWAPRGPGAAQKCSDFCGSPLLYIGGHYANPAMRAINVTSMQAAIPVSVGIRKAAAVHFQLPVSL